MNLKLTTKHRQNFLISFHYCLYHNKYTNDQLVKQHYNQLAGSVTENVAKLSYASERMQAAERAHNFVVDFCLQTTSTIVEVLRCRSLPSRLIRRTVDADEMSNSCRSPSLISVCVDLFVARGIFRRMDYPKDLCLTCILMICQSPNAEDSSMLMTSVAVLAKSFE